MNCSPLYSLRKSVSYALRERVSFGDERSNLEKSMGNADLLRFQFR
jgi:hypothetical protein